MIRSLAVDGYLSMRGAAIDLAPLTVVAGSSATARSGLTNAVGFLGATAAGDLYAAFAAAGDDPWIASAGLRSPIRFEAVVELSEASVRSEAAGAPPVPAGRALRYSLEIGPRGGAGGLAVASETLVALDGGGEFVTTRGGRVEAPPERRSRPLTHGPGMERTAVSSPAPERDHPHLAAFRRELASWRTHRTRPAAARNPSPRIGIERPSRDGSRLAAFFNLMEGAHPRTFGTMNAALRALLPSAESTGAAPVAGGQVALRVDEGGVRFGHEQISDGTVRILALLAAALAPDDASVVCVEQPEAGVHAPRLEEVAALLAETAARGRQCIATTQSPMLAELLARAGALVLAHSSDGGFARIAAGRSPGT